jgi:RNA 2',3'-cyclic 3'-phosphodiesterase
MRVFIALDIDDAIRDRIARFVEGVSGFAPDARWVRPESLHVTLKFIGEKSEDDVEKIKRELEKIRAGALELNIRGFGFFPNANAARVFWIGVESDHKLSSLARAVDEAMAALDIPTEEHAYNPHLTLARNGSSRSPKRKAEGKSRNFVELERRVAPLPALEFGTMWAREFFLYRSQTSPGGSKYTKLSQFALQ